jgi:uncharacterized membrane protein YraQ (UPF0718 family)
VAVTVTTLDARRIHGQRIAGAVGVGIVVVLAAGLLWWAKWGPYTDTATGLASSHHWSGHSTLDAAGVHAGSAPSWAAGWSYTVHYGISVWKALLAALLIAAALQSLVPRDWLVGMLSRRRDASSATAGGLASMPSMMCTCCSAPVAVALRRCGAPTAAVLAYWMGNPLLNPAVLVFLALVAPWQWVATRAAIGVLLVVGGATFIARFARGRTLDPDAVPLPAASAGPPVADFSLAAAPARFARALLKLAAVLVPEYFAVVLLVGAFGGWLFPLAGGSGSLGEPLAVGAAVTLGTLFVVPTAGEIPLLQGLSAAGFGVGVIGALLITLPAVSLPSLAMVGRALTWRVTVAVVGVVAIAGLCAALLLTGLT